MNDRNRGPHPWVRRTAVLGALALLLATGNAGAATLSGVVNVNTASSQELQLLPGVGEARARAIVHERDSRGGFRDVRELVEVKGIGAAMLERLRPFLTVSGKTTAKVH